MIKVLSKIHEAKWIDYMYENEYLYFNTITAFRKKATDSSGRDDPRELNLANWQIYPNSQLVLAKDGEKLPSVTLKSRIIVEYPIEINVNCCSLHWIHLSESGAPESLNKRLFALGDRILIIHDSQGFLKSMVKALEGLSIKHDRGDVDYYDPYSYNGELTPFHKDQEFSFQNEYRILLYSNRSEPIKISIPGLKNFSKVLDMQSYENLRISPVQ